MEKNIEKLLNIMQNDFPLESRPFLTIANKLGMTEDEVIERIKQLKEEKYVRRLGGIFDSKELGYVGTLCAIEVPEARIEVVSEIVNGYTQVTHNYIRNHRYNMWFTVISSSKENVQDIISQIKVKTNINNIMILDSLNTFKIKVNFNVGGNTD